MAITITTAALTTAFGSLLTDSAYGVSNYTFQLYKDSPGTRTLVASFTSAISNFVATNGQAKYDGAGALVFTVPPSSLNVDSIQLNGVFASGGAQMIARWDLDYTPTDYTKDFPDGGSLSLGQWIMSATTE